MKILKWFGISLAVLLGVIGLMVLWSALEYGNHPLVAHQRISITLPYDPENEVTNLIPMGETIAHPNKGGHPGIDFQWEHSAPLIAVADGVVTSIRDADDMGEPVKYLTLKMGSYKAEYKELDKIADGITKGSVVSQGQILGFPHGSVGGEGKTHYQLHWEFSYSTMLPALSGKPDRLCPLTYFNTEARKRIEASWENVSATDRFKKDFPYICSNVYRNHDQ